MVETQEPSNIKPRRRGSSPLVFVLLGLLWFALGGLIISQLPTTLNNSITVMWETETETENAGFNVYRAEAVNKGCDSAEVQDDSYKQVNDELISAKGGAIEGGSYRWTDSSNVERGKHYCYILEDVELTGATQRHDPIYGKPRNALERILYLVLAPVSLIVGVSLIVNGVKGGR